MTDTLKKSWKHFKLICNHKRWVGYYCFKLGIPFRGIMHDMSKFSPTEFCESVKYYTGTRSPIDVCKERNGVSKAWMHHKGRNRHHYEYWQDNFDKGGHPVQMPMEDAFEMLCDYLGASRAYTGKNFSFTGEYNWWCNKIANGIAMHPQTKYFINSVLEALMKAETDGRNPNVYLNRLSCEAFYDNATSWYNRQVNNV